MNENTKNNAAPVDIIKEVYALSPNIDFIVWVCPYSYIVPDFVEKLFSSIILDPATTNIGPLRGYRIMFAHRSNFLPKLTVRNARVEDNDDLIPIIQHSNPDILMGQDRYFLADLIQHQDLNNRFFVGLKKNHIVGMLATSLDVNMSLIMKIFDIDAYPDLIIQSDSIPPPPPLLIGIIGDLRLLEVEGLEEMLYDQNVIVINLEKIAVHLQDYQHGDHASALMNYVQHMMQNFHTPSQLQAVILWGFPRSESEATEHMKTMVHEFDIVLELLNVSEEVDDDEEEDDDFLQQHLDAVEVVRDYYFKDVDHNAGGHGKDKKKAVWRKVSYDQDSYHSNKKDNLVRLHTAVVQCLDERVQRMEAAKVLNKEKPPKANAFAITALCMEEEFSSRSMDLIKLAFEEQPDYAYCLYMVGNQRAPSRETGCLNFIKTRPGISFDQSLYIINRSYFYVQDHLRVARIEEQMMEDIYSFLAPVKQRERMEIVDAMQGSLQENDVSLLDNPYQVSFAIKIGEKTIGTAILTRKILTNEDVNWYRLHYHIDELVNFSRHRTRSQYVLLHWMIDPIFSTWTRLIIRQIMRLCNKTVLYYHSERDIAPPKEIIEDFVFVRPRRVIQGENAAYKNRPQPHQANASEGKEAENGHQSMGVYALGEDAQLFCILKPSLAFKKSLIATRVVILGGSAHSQACLETICSVPYVYYPNIYYIVEVVPGPMKGLLNTGSSNTTETSAAIDELHSKQDKEYYGGCLSLQDVEHPSEGELHAMGYAHRINIIKGHLTDIDRENKAVVISDEFVVEYDYLIISTYQQGKFL